MSVRDRRVLAAGACALALSGAAAWAAVIPQGTGRFDALVVYDPGTGAGVVPESPDRTPGSPIAATWSEFRSRNGAAWSVYVDRRSGVPTLVSGAGIPWLATGETPSATLFGAKARQLVSDYASAIGISPAELALDTEGTGEVRGGNWVVVLDRVVSGVPVEGEHFIAYVDHGNLVSFGADRWGAITASPTPAVNSQSAMAALRAYMGLTASDVATTVEPGRLVYVAAPPAGETGGTYAGPVGQGIDHVLAWRFALAVDGEPGTWVGKVDASNGAVIAFYDDDKYGQVTGGVFPISNDGDCANLGCEEAGFPMAYSNVTVGKTATTSDDMGEFRCARRSKRSSAVLTGPYANVNDNCGNGSASGNCTGVLDFGTSTGTDCTTPSGGDTTHSARTAYYHVNRLKDKARYWLPSNTWLTQRLSTTVDISATCNAYYNGNLNFYRSGGGCRNTGEIANVIHHEYGHGLDQNDGGGYDNPSEGYADVIAVLEARGSCVGRGFYMNGTCSGYGDACLTCTGIRDDDYDAHAAHTPATPAGFIVSHCGGGSGPCGREVHCESYVPAEAIYDLAARDLPAAGLDPDSSWQVAERLFYTSRQGSGGNAYTCSLNGKDGCGASTWYQKVLAADDDDGNLANGTPHAAAIFAAFDRHGIACGLATDPGNQSTSSCLGLNATTVTATPGTGSVTLTWDPVANAASYLILRSDVGCGYSSVVIGTVFAPTTSFTDTSLPAAFPLYYRVQPVESRDACVGPVSACVTAAAN